MIFADVLTSKLSHFISVFNRHAEERSIPAWFEWLQLIILIEFDFLIVVEMSRAST